MLYITNKTERFSSKSRRVIQVAKHLKEDWCIVLLVAIAAYNNFVPLLKSFIANVLKRKAYLKVKVKCVSVTMYSLVMKPSHMIEKK